MNYSDTLNMLQEKGYYIGTFDDFWQDDNGVSKEEWDWAVNVFRNSAKNVDELYMYRHNFTDQNTFVFVDDPNYKGPTPTDEEKLQEVDYTRRDHRKQFIKLAKENGRPQMRTTQQWGRLDLSKGDYESHYKMNDIFSKLIKNFCVRIYPYLNETKDTFLLATQYSLYVDEDFADIHHDGINPGRACAIIIYLADPDTYNDDGGRLVISKEKIDYVHDWEDRYSRFPNNYEFVKPVYGYYAILDFTKHNVGHAIEKVKNDFKRLAIQTFVGP